MLKILIVDDDSTMRKLLKTILTKEFECEIIEARNGLEGMSEVKTHKPDLVILDVMMPLFSGEKMLELMKSDKVLSNIKVVVLTANSSKYTVNKFLELGVQEFVIKPFNSVELVNRLKKLLALN